MSASGNLKPRKTRRRNPLGRYSPVVINAQSRWRFLRRRRVALIVRIGGRPDERQALIIDMLARAEWDEWCSTHDAAEATDVQARRESLRLANEARRQVLLWDRALASTTPKPAAPEPPRRKTLDELFPDRNLPA